MMLSFGSPAVGSVIQYRYRRVLKEDEMIHSGYGGEDDDDESRWTAPRLRRLVQQGKRSFPMLYKPSPANPIPPAGESDATEAGFKLNTTTSTAFNDFYSMGNQSLPLL